MNLPKKINFDKIQMIVHFLLFFFHLLIIIVLRSVFLIVKIREVQGEIFFKEYERYLLVALDELSLKGIIVMMS